MSLEVIDWWEIQQESPEGFNDYLRWCGKEPSVNKPNLVLKSEIEYLEKVSNYEKLEEFFDFKSIRVAICIKLRGGQFFIRIYHSNKCAVDDYKEYTRRDKVKKEAFTQAFKEYQNIYRRKHYPIN